MTAQVADRPRRADARRNYDRLLVAAHDVFTERGGDASLEEIARRAGVGIGTLYRHFPTRLDVVEAVYRDDIERLETLAAEDGAEDAWSHLVRWVDQLVEYIVTKKALFAELHEALSRNESLVSACRDSLRRGADDVLARAQRAGVVREDIDGGDLLLLARGVTVTPTESREQIRRLIGVVLDGLRAGQPPARRRTESGTAMPSRRSGAATGAS